MKIRNFFSSLALILLVAAQSNSLNAQVVINEFSASNLSQFVDNHSDYEDWIELYNTGGSAVVLTGYYLSDDSLQNTKWQILAGISIGANSFLRFWCSGRNEIAPPHYHTNFRLTQTKNNPECVVLSNPSGAIIDYLEITTRTQKGHSYGRTTDGASTWGIFTSPTPLSSNNSSTPKTKYADKPNASITAGYYPSAITVALTTTEPGSSIRYTTNGMLPTSSSTLYTAPISITSTKVLKAVTFSTDPNVLESFVEFNTYFIGPDTHTVVVVSIAGTQLDELANGNSSLEPTGTFEYFNTNRIRTAKTYGEFNKHGQDSWALSQRSLDFVSRDEMGYNHSVEEVLFNTTLMKNFQRVMLRAAGDDNYPADHNSSNEGSAHLRDAYIHNLSLSGGLNVEVRRGSKCVVYLNGTYWGVYDIRDNPDNHDLINYYYGQNRYELYMLKIWGSTWAEYGGNAAFNDWNNVYNYIMNNNMSNAANFNWVNDRLDVTSLVDYVLINMFTVCSDWLNWNVCWWRGLDSTGTHLKWGYQLWDNDATFGHYINYTGIPNTTPTAAPCDPEGLDGSSDPEDHIGVLLKLRQNPDFNQYYITRQHDLWNTVFSCDNMLAQLDSTKAVIAPEMTRHCARWAGNYTEWSDNFQQLRDFIIARCTAIIPGWLSCYSLNGPYDITIDANPAVAGSIKMNSLTHDVLPWTGTYFGGIDTKLDVLPNTNFNFLNWSATTQTFNPNPSAVSVKVNLSGSDTIVAHFSTTGVPELFSLSQPIVSAFPTVTSNAVIIQYSLPEATPVSIKLYSILGNQLVEIINPQKTVSAGNHVAEINLASSKLPGGIYMLDFVTGNFRKSIKLIYSPQ